MEPASAQFIKGKVIEDNGEPVENVSVKNISTGEGGTTNDSGNFVIKGLAGEILEFTKTGYTVYTKTLLKDEKILNILFRKSDNPLDEVVISASKTAQELKNTSVSMEVIKPYIVQNKNPLTAENIIDQIPGVQTINGQVVIRSGSGWSYGAGSRVMVMLDGMPLASGDAGQVQWSFIPLDNLQSMEVIKGASSVLFGSSALNGVINIRTASPGPKPVTRATVFFGKYGKPEESSLDWNNGKPLFTYGIRAFHSRKYGKNSLTLNINTMNDDGYRMSDKDDRGRFGIQYKRDIKKIKGSLGLDANIQSGHSSSFLLWQSNSLAYTSLDSNITESQTFRFNLDPRFIAFTGRFKHLLQARYLRVSNEVIQQKTREIQSNFSDFYFIEYQISGSFFNQIRFTGGITGNLASSNSPLYQGLQNSSNAAVFLQLNKKYRKWNIDAGTRYERYQLNDYKEAKPVFRAGVSRAMGKSTFARASFGQGYRFPTIAESYILTNVGPLKIYPNTELRSEQGWNAEIGIKQGLVLGKLNGILDVALFRMEYTRMMEFAFGQWERNTSTFGFGFRSLNVSDARIEGIDVSLTGIYKFNKGNIKWLTGYTYANAVALDPDKVFYVDSMGNQLTFNSTSSNPETGFLKYRPKNLVRADMQIEFYGFETGISFRYNSALINVDKAFVSFPISLVVPGIQETRDQGKNGDYIFDLRVAKSFKKRKLAFIVNNVLNRFYMTRPSEAMPPRSFMLQYTRTID
ncbi:MAG: TonB-dependent receptor plug domain-containing protein [Flavobacteriales bacterium]|nr:TonB-dependent receptor plug domain-containing protein [Flavobacteriales bacterium]